MPSNKIRHSRKERKVLTEEDYHPDQNFCSDCAVPINKNCHKSVVMKSKCGKCYRIMNREDERRILQKTRTNQRQNQRRYKYQVQNF